MNFYAYYKQPLPEIDLFAITLKPIVIDKCTPMTRYVYA